MNSSDERIDEELRKALRQRFDNFERLPDPTLREKIFKGLGGGTSMVQTGVVATLMALIVLTATMYLTSVSVTRKQEMAAGVPKVIDQATPERTIGNPQSDEENARPVDNGLELPVKSRPVETMRAARIDDSRQVQAIGKHHKYKRADLRKFTAMARSNPSIGSIWINDRDISPADKAFVETETNKILSDNSLPDSVAAIKGDMKELEGPSLADQDIGVLDHRPLALPQYNWQPDSVVTPAEPQKRYEFLFKEYWTIVTALTPLRTFQILTVRPGNGVVYQNFVLPGKISAETVGYKFSAGVERKGFQLLLNYGQFKQSYRYEIATSEFTVGPDLSGNYEVVRKGIPQYENSTVRLVGLALKKHTVRRSHFLRNYFGDFGAEFSRDLTSKKNLVWVNAGFGKELFAGNNAVMTVGPYFEYSLSKLRNPDNPFKIQPYQIGLSVGLRYTRK